MNTVRVSVKAIIIEDGKLLALHQMNKNSNWYTLPGGGQENGETLTEALNRECLEEAGVKISVGEVAFIRDYIANNHEFAQEKPGFHQVEIMFLCKLAEKYVPKIGTTPDTNQIGVEWLDLSRIIEYSLYPATLKNYLYKGTFSQTPIYLGDVN